MNGSTTSSFCSPPLVPGKRIGRSASFSPRNEVPFRKFAPQVRNSSKSYKTFRVRASGIDSHDNSSNFVNRMERAWLISQQPRPVICASCNSKGHVECNWCAGTGFFIIGNNMLCQVPSRNTSCVICIGKGSTCCADCQGTGFRAKWLEQPVSK